MSKLNYNLTLAGAWNPSILQPNWLAKIAFGLPLGTEVTTLMMISSMPNPPLRFILKDVIFTITNDRLMLEPEEGKDVAYSEFERIAQTILTTLSHTPFVGFGENFSYNVNQPSEALLTLFGYEDNIDESIPNATNIENAIIKSYQLDDCLLRLSRMHTNNTVEFSFNFHYEDALAESASAKLPNTLEKNYNRAKAILAHYNCEI